MSIVLRVLQCYRADTEAERDLAEGDLAEWNMTGLFYFQPCRISAGLLKESIREVCVCHGTGYDVSIL